MLPLEIPPGTTIESLVTKLVPELHGRLVQEGGPNDELTIAVRIDGSGSWTLRIRGARMMVVEGEDDPVTLWLYATSRDVTRFLQDGVWRARLTPKEGNANGVATMTDPKVLKRVAMANGRMEIAVRDEAGERTAMVLGFGGAARRAIDPNGADVFIEAGIATVERVLLGELRPEEVLSDGTVTLRGNRFLAMQLALALAPFWKATA